MKYSIIIISNNNALALFTNNFRLTASHQTKMFVAQETSATSCGAFEVINIGSTLQCNIIRAFVVEKTSC
jgi:hypothetical protein